MDKIQFEKQSIWKGSVWLSHLSKFRMKQTRFGVGNISSAKLYVSLNFNAWRIIYIWLLVICSHSHNLCYTVLAKQRQQNQKKLAKYFINKKKELKKINRKKLAIKRIQTNGKSIANKSNDNIACGRRIQAQLLHWNQLEMRMMKVKSVKKRKMEFTFLSALLTNKT